MTLTKQVAANGSYGIYAPVGDNGKRLDGGYSDGPINVWFCGGRRPGAIPGTVQAVCAHGTRQAARECPNRQ